MRTRTRGLSRHGGDPQIKLDKLLVPCGNIFGAAFLRSVFGGGRSENERVAVRVCGAKFGIFAHILFVGGIQLNRFCQFMMVLLIGLSAAAIPASAQVIAKVTGLTDNALVERSGSRQRLSRNFGLVEGDTITTDAQGSVQIAFVDRTRMVIGPSSQLVIENITMSSQTRASQFSVRALGGTYRFLSGNSPKPAYKLRTPTATMGIRGTEFDFSVDSRRVTNLVTYSGRVSVCTRRNRCFRVSGGCAVVSVVRNNVQTPETEEDKKRLLAVSFPFLVNQTQLANDYRAQVGPCGEVGSVDVTQTTTTTTTTTTTQTQRRDAGVDYGGGGDVDGGGYSESADEN